MEGSLEVRFARYTNLARVNFITTKGVFVCTHPGYLEGVTDILGVVKFSNCSVMLSQGATSVGHVLRQ